MKRWVLFIYVLLCCCRVGAKQYLLEGTAGNDTLVMKLVVDGDIANSRFFYKSNVTDVEFNGSYNNGIVHLYAADSSASMILKQLPDRTWTGKLAKDKHQIISLKLHIVNINAVKHSFSYLSSVKSFKKNDQYEYLRSACFKLVNDTLFRYDSNYKIQTCHIKNTELNAIKIVADTVSKVVDKVNNILMDMLVQNAVYCKSCIAQDTNLSYGYSFDYTIKGNVLSAYVSLSLSCSGAMRMDYSDQTFNYDLNTGRPLVLDDVLYFKGVNGDNALQGNKIMSLLHRLYPDKMVNIDYCDYTDTLAWQNTDWRITEKGLLLMPYFVRADLPCWDPDWPVISFDLLKKYRNPNKKVHW